MAAVIGPSTHPLRTGPFTARTRSPSRSMRQRSPEPTRAISRRCGSSRNQAPVAAISALETFWASMTRMGAVAASSAGAGVLVRGAAQAINVADTVILSETRDLLSRLQSSFLAEFTLSKRVDPLLAKEWGGKAFRTTGLRFLPRAGCFPQPLERRGMVAARVRPRNKPRLECR